MFRVEEQVGEEMERAARDGVKSKGARARSCLSPEAEDGASLKHKGSGVNIDISVFLSFDSLAWGLDHVWFSQIYFRIIAHAMDTN